MEIVEIKHRLSLAQVLQYYNLKPDKQLRLNCPFHEDKTPSMQIYYKTHTAYCFSSNCPTNGKSMDVIDFIMYKEKCTKHEAIKKAQSMITGNIPEPLETKTQFLTKIYTYFKNAVHNSQPAKDYLQQRHLDPRQIEVGYNAAQFHHGARKNPTLIENCLRYGLLLDKNLTGRTGEKAYGIFGKNCIVFALRNPKHEITGLYFRSTTGDKDQRHFYLKNREGVYPHYPDPETTKLILTESIIDAATLLQQPEIKQHYGILALYGTNGLTGEHTEALSRLEKLEEIILFLNGDQPGRTATQKHYKTLKALYPAIKITTIEVPEGEDINSLLDGHTPQILTGLINSRQSIQENPTVEFSFSTEINPIETSTEKEKNTPPLDTTNPYNIKYTGLTAHYYIKGGLKHQLDSLRISLQIIRSETGEDYRTKLDLYEYKHIDTAIQQASEKLGLRADLMGQDLSRLTMLLEEYRETHLLSESYENKKLLIKLSEATTLKCIDFLKSSDLIGHINKLIGQSGVTGEDTNRIFLYIIASSYKMPDTLHALIQGSSGSGKTHLLTKILSLMPPEDVISLTRATESSFYNYEEYELSHKLFGLEDTDGLEEKALLAFRELISRGQIVSSTSYKDERGNIKARIKTVKGPIASMSCTTKGEIYEDNMSRCFIVAVDESHEQTLKIIRYQNEIAAGNINKKEQQNIKEFLQNCMRLIRPYEVINPYANKLTLPQEAHKIRRLNELYQSFVKQITLLNQYQREKDKEGRLISCKEDLQTACEIMFDSILLKIDELDGSLRNFFEQLKKHIRKKGIHYEFTRLEIRQTLGTKKGIQHHYINKLVELEYLQQKGHANRGYKYSINYWDNLEAMRHRIKQYLNEQLEKL
jgi:DNA primase/energy-coupling factor transporter ATP-binding protein EcfA2